MWVSRIGGVSGFAEGYARPNDCAPAVVSVEAVDTARSKNKKVVLLPPEDRFVVLLEAGPYA